MKENRQDLTTGSIWGKMLFFSIPLVLTNLLQVLFNMADIAVIGQFAGSLSLGGCGIYHHTGNSFYRDPDRYGGRYQCSGSQILWGEG